MRPDSFYKVAEFLQEHKNETEQEGAERSAVSRAYYSALHYCRDFLAEEGVDWGEDEATHVKVIRGLQDCAGVSKEIFHVGETLSRFRELREDADYTLADGKDSFDWDRLFDWGTVVDYHRRVLKVADVWNSLDSCKKEQALDAFRRRVGLYE